MNRRQSLLALPIAVLLFSCSGPNADTDAQEVCDCFIKANSIPEEDPKRADEQDKCSELQMEKLKNYRSAEEQKKFSEALVGCSERIMRNALEEEM